MNDYLNPVGITRLLLFLLVEADTNKGFKYHLMK